MMATLVFGWFKHPEYATGGWRSVVIMLKDVKLAKRKAVELWGREPTLKFRAFTINASKGCVIDCQPEAYGLVES